MQYSYFMFAKGKPSPEARKIGARGGKSRSIKKIKAAQKNGKRGGKKRRIVPQGIWRTRKEVSHGHSDDRSSDYF